jgi:hypothetical protein
LSGVANLIADGGEGAIAPHFFRSRQFFDAEGVTHTLRIEIAGGTLSAPLRVEPIAAGSELDGCSPYGYPGLSGPAGLAVDPGEVDFTPTGLVSIFLRHRLDEVALSDATLRNVVQVANPELKPKSRAADRRQVKRNEESGYRTEIAPGASTTPEQRAAFAAVYEQKMQTLDADNRYRFSPAYFDRVLEAEHTWLVLTRTGDGEVAAASIVVMSDGFLHYYLTGIANSRQGESPTKNVVSALIGFSTQIGLPLNLGGGLATNPGLETFKRGFANEERDWCVSQIVCDPAAYERLVGDRKAGDFFPAYRAP